MEVAIVLSFQINSTLRAMQYVKSLIQESFTLKHTIMKNNQPEQQFLNTGKEIASWLLSAGFFFVLFRLIETMF